jgi:PEP-CTERM motif
MKLRTLAFAAALMGAAQSHAVTIFSDDFNADALALNQTIFVGGWTVSDGAVDLIGATGFFDFYPGNGRFVDLDGSSGNAGVFSKTLNLTAGVSYSASFVLAGSTRGDTNVVEVDFGTSAASYTLPSGAPFAVAAPVQFTPVVSGSYTLSFANQGGDNLGAILDNVAVESIGAPIPEPGTYALMLAGLVAVGAVARRRQAS